MDRRVIAIALSMGLVGFGDPAYFAINSGNKLYSEGKYEEALAEYSKAKTADPKRVEADYNMGAAQFKTGRFKESIGSYDRAIKEGPAETRPDSAYNRSAALYASGASAKEAGELDEAVPLLKAAVEGYKAVLKEKPSDNDARHNLEIALEKLKETEKEKQEHDSQSGGGDSREPDKQDKQDKKDGSGKEEKPEDEKQQSADKKQDQEKSSGAEEKQEMTKEEAERVFSAVESDEKDLRKHIRSQNLKERPKSGKDW